MRNYNKILLWLLMLCLTVSMLAGCIQETEEEAPPTDGTTTEEESQAQIELEALQVEYNQLSADYNDLESELEAKVAEYDGLNTEYDSLSTQYEELNADYNELSTEYEALKYEPETITNEEVEEILFDLINQDRLDNRLPDLEWSDHLHWWAKQHSEYMATEKKLEFEESDQVFWQDVFRAPNYGSAEKIAKAALTLWKDNQYYAKNFLVEQTEYAAVAVARSGEIFCITYFASMQP